MRIIDRKKTEDVVRGAMLSWYGFTSGGAISDVIMKGNPKANVVEMLTRLRKLERLLQSTELDA